MPQTVTAELNKLIEEGRPTVVKASPHQLWMELHDGCMWIKMHTKFGTLEIPLWPEVFKFTKNSITSDEFEKMAEEIEVSITLPGWIKEKK